MILFTLIGRDWPAKAKSRRMAQCDDLPCFDCRLIQKMARTGPVRVLARTQPVKGLGALFEFDQLYYVPMITNQIAGKSIQFSVRVLGL